VSPPNRRQHSVARALEISRSRRGSGVAQVSAKLPMKHRRSLVAKLMPIPRPLVVSPPSKVVMDVFSKTTRSEIMARVRGRGNARTEMALVKILRRHKISGWLRNQALFGRPDFVFKASRVAVFVDGCFWHNCPIHSKCPSSNIEFWKRKLSRNAVRDAKVDRELRRQGWRVVRIWQHDLSGKNEHKVVTRLHKAMKVTDNMNRRR